MLKRSHNSFFPRVPHSPVYVDVYQRRLAVHERPTTANSGNGPPFPGEKKSSHKCNSLALMCKTYRKGVFDNYLGHVMRRTCDCRLKKPICTHPCCVFFLVAYPPTYHYIKAPLAFVGFQQYSASQTDQLDEDHDDQNDHDDHNDHDDQDDHLRRISWTPRSRSPVPTCSLRQRKEPSLTRKSSKKSFR